MTPQIQTRFIPLLIPAMLLALLLSAQCAQAGWYEDIQRNTALIRELTSPRTKGAKRRGATCKSPGRKRGERMYRPIILEASRKYGVHPDFIQAVIWQESRFDKHARSTVGAVGLMQLMPTTALEMGVSDRRDPRQSIMGGTRYLRLMLDQFQDVPTALAAYNAGPGKTRNVLNKRDTFKPQTINYVPEVIAEFNRLRRERKK